LVLISSEPVDFILALWSPDSLSPCLSHFLGISLKSETGVVLVLVGNVTLSLNIFGFGTGGLSGHDGEVEPELGTAEVGADNLDFCSNFTLLLLLLNLSFNIELDIPVLVVQVALELQLHLSLRPLSLDLRIFSLVLDSALGSLSFSSDTILIVRLPGP